MIIFYGHIINGLTNKMQRALMQRKLVIAFDDILANFECINAFIHIGYVDDPDSISYITKRIGEIHGYCIDIHTEVAARRMMTLSGYRSGHRNPSVPSKRPAARRSDREYPYPAWHIRESRDPMHDSLPHPPLDESALDKRIREIREIRKQRDPSVGGAAAAHPQSVDQVAAAPPPAVIHTLKKEDFGVQLPLPSQFSRRVDEQQRQRVLLETLGLFESKSQFIHTTAINNFDRWNRDAKEPYDNKIKVLVKEADWGDVTMEMTKQFGVIFAVLNMANSYVPGGGYADGLVAQEENMLTVTSLYHVI